MDLEKESKKIKIKNKQKMVRGRYVLKAPKPLPLEMSMLVEKNKYDSIQKRSVSSNRKIVLLPDFKPTTESKEGPGMSPKFWQKTGRGYVGKHRPKSTFVRKKNTIDKKKRIISFLPSGTKQRKTRSSRHVEGKIENAEEVKAKEVKNEELKEAEVKKIKDEGVKEAEPKLSEIKKNDAVETCDSHAFPFDKINIKLNSNVGIAPSVLTNLIKKSGYKPTFNKIRNQELKTDDSTCGRWVLMRLLFKNYNIKEFNKILKDFKKDNCLDALELATIYTYNKILK